MIIHKIKCPECNKKIEGRSEKEVNAWLEQHRYYSHEKQKEEKEDEPKSN